MSTIQITINCVQLLTGCQRSFLTQSVAMSMALSLHTDAHYRQEIDLEGEGEVKKSNKT